MRLADLAPDIQNRVRADLRVALWGGAMAAVVMGGVVVTVGAVGAGEARSLLQDATPTVRSFASTLMVVCASTLALMLTMLGLTTDTDADVSGGHFTRIRQIAFVDACAFAGATLLLLALVIPFNEATEIPRGWYVGIYYAATLLAAGLGGAVVAVMILLYAAVRDLILTFGPSDADPLLADDEDADGAHQRAEAG